MPGVEVQPSARPRVALVRLNSPERRNALDAETRRQILAALDELRGTETRAVVLTGTDSVFAAGADLRETARRTSREQRAFIAPPRMYEHVEGYPRPVVAAISGHALGAGLELAMACDARVAAEDARLGAPEIRLGLIPGGGGTQRLPRLAGMGRALEMILTGEPISGAEAAVIGLVNRAVARERVVDEALDMAEKMARWSPIALEQAKRAVRLAWRLPIERGVVAEIEHFMTAYDSQDAKEGVRAFLEKREPAFKGR
ncbi:MAG: enoyl-CoA hydratase/isomerase family protein [Candidatus Rokuibacteriota bacterium]